MTKPQTSCPSCGQNVSPKAFDCPHCGHPIRKPKRGIFGKLFKWSFVLFNILMIVWLFGAINVLSESAQDLQSDAETAGFAIGGTIGMGLLLSIWVLGDIILGLLVLLTRPRK